MLGYRRVVEEPNNKEKVETLPTTSLLANYRVYLNNVYYRSMLQVNGQAA